MANNSVRIVTVTIIKLIASFIVDKLTTIVIKIKFVIIVNYHY